MIFNSNSEFSWNKSHAQVPVLIELEDKVRLFYSSRDSQNISYTSFIDIDKKGFPEKIIYTHSLPILELGKDEEFDSAGIMPTCCIKLENKYYLYYIGWRTKGISTPYENAIGLAVSENGLDFRKIDQNPIISRGGVDKFFTGTFFVFQAENIFRGYYLSCFDWISDNRGNLNPVYNIKYAESNDGIIWNKCNKVSVDLYENEGGIASASVFKDNGTYRMLFSSRGRENFREDLGSTYRIYSAVSEDGVFFKRIKDEYCLEVSTEGWDSEMVAYPYVFLLNNNKYLFYNGNGFGKSGIGYAIWK